MTSISKFCVSSNGCFYSSYSTAPLWIGIMVLTLVMELTVETLAQGATLIVNTAEDIVDASDGVLSLREANTEAQAGDTITFDTALSGQTITLFSFQNNVTSQLTIDKDLTIKGLGAPQLTIHSFLSILEVVSETVVTIADVTINCRTVANEFCRGISNHGTLTLIDSVVSGKETDDFFQGGERAGIRNYGDMTLINSVVSDHDLFFGSPSGIVNSGSMKLLKSIVTNNRNRFGVAGISNGGTMILIDSTVKGNVAFDSRVGIACTRGGGIANSGMMELLNTTVSGNRGAGNAGIVNAGMLTLTNSTVSGNTTLVGTHNCNGSGIYNYRNGDVRLINSTIANNVVTDVDVEEFGASSGGGIVNAGGTVALLHSIVGGNKATNSPDCVGPISSLGYNLVGAGTGCPSDGLGDLTVIPDDVFTDILGPLQNNGGPTDTHGLLNNANNHAIDSGNPAGCLDQEGEGLTTDQRGLSRPSGRGTVAICDIGAVELQVFVMGDLDGNGCVDQTDLTMILATVRGAAALEPSHDLNGDGGVSIADARKLVTLFTNARGLSCL